VSIDTVPLLPLQLAVATLRNGSDIAMFVMIGTSTPTLGVLGAATWIVNTNTELVPSVWVSTGEIGSMEVVLMVVTRRIRRSCPEHLHYRIQCYPQFEQLVFHQRIPSHSR
jgi:hypothetical protein